MIDQKLIPVSGLKREPYSGCHRGMRYYFAIDNSKESFTATVYPEPWSFENTPDKDKECSCFPMTTEGMDAANNWLYDRYETKKELWKNANKNKMHV
jgi:hypothetical protein